MQTLESALETIRKTKNKRWLSYTSVQLALAYLDIGDAQAAKTVIESALEIATPEFRYQLMAAQGLAAISTGDLTQASTSFTAVQHVTDAMPDSYVAAYMHALVVAGLWVLEQATRQATMDAYQRAIAGCHADGVLAEARRLLTVLQSAANATDLAPLFDLLQRPVTND